MRFVLIAASVVITAPASAKAEAWEQVNSKCESTCKSTLDRCAAAANKLMAAALKETSAYNVGRSERESADIRFRKRISDGRELLGQVLLVRGKMSPADEVHKPVPIRF